METPKTKADLLAWLIENYKRLSLKTPKFFVVWQTIGIIALLVGFVPDALVFLDITTSEVFNDKLQIILKVAGGITWFMNKMPVMSNTRPVDAAGDPVQKYEALPFTSKKQENKL